MLNRDRLVICKDSIVFSEVHNDVVLLYARLETSDLTVRLDILTAIACKQTHCCSTISHHRQVIDKKRHKNLQLQVVLTTRRCTIIQVDRWLPWLLNFHLTPNCWVLRLRILTNSPLTKVHQEGF